MTRSILHKGDTVALIAPAGAITEQKLSNSIKNLEDLGLKPVYLKTITNQMAYLAGEDNRRAAELIDMYHDKSVKAILCVRGGYGSMRILDLIDYSLIKANPKPLIGYSDITALHNAIYLKTKQIGFHGLLGAELFSKYSKDAFNAVFFDNSEWITLEQFEDHKDSSFTIKPGCVEGNLIGGNLSLLTSLIGTKYDFDWKEKIICIEEVSEPPYKIDRMLTQLIMAGKFSHINGILFGQFHKCDAEDVDQSKNISIKELLIEKIKSLNIPACYGFSFGHIPNQTILPVGAHVEFDAENFQIKFKRSELKEFL
jgi:muramoyltetrapeptide carboxypeptidase